MGDKKWYKTAFTVSGLISLAIILFTPYPISYVPNNPNGIYGIIALFLLVFMGVGMVGLVVNDKISEGN